MIIINYDIINDVFKNGSKTLYLIIN